MKVVVERKTERKRARLRRQSMGERKNEEHTKATRKEDRKDVVHVKGFWIEPREDVKGVIQSVSAAECITTAKRHLSVRNATEVIGSTPKEEWRWYTEKGVEGKNGRKRRGRKKEGLGAERVRGMDEQG